MEERFQFVTSSKSGIVNAQHRNKILQVLKNKLIPLNQNGKYPMGKTNYIKLSRLQKAPRLNKISFKKKIMFCSQFQEQILKVITNREQQNRQQSVQQRIYQHSGQWINLWMRTGDNYQQQYIQAQEKQNIKRPSYPYQQSYPKDYLHRFRHKNSQQIKNSIILAKNLLKKVENHKERKTKQIKDKYKQSSQFGSLHEQNLQRNYNQLYKKRLLNNQNVNTTVNQHNNNYWVQSIAQYLLSSYSQIDEMRKVIKEKQQRQKLNRLPQIISLFNSKKSSNTTRSCHINSRSQEKAKTYRIKKVVQNQSSETIFFTDPESKLKYLQSICKAITLNQNLNEKDNNLVEKQVQFKKKLVSSKKKLLINKNPLHS